MNSGLQTMTQPLPEGGNELTVTDMYLGGIMKILTFLNCQKL